MALAGCGLALVVGCQTTPPPDPGEVTLTVTVTANGGASGTVVSSPLGIEVTSGSQSAAFASGAIVRLTAMPGEDSSFVGFAPAGVCAAGSPASVCVVALASATSIQATFQSDEVIPPLPPFPDRLDIVATAPVAGAYLEFTVPAGVSVISVSPLRSGVLLRTSSTDGRVRISWVGTEAQSEDQLRIDFATDAGTVGAPEVVSALVLGSHDGPDLGASTLSTVAPSAAVASTLSLVVDQVEHGTDVTLLPSYADHPLGDVDGDGVLSVRDALWLLERTIDGAWTDFERYHADLDADDVTDVVDLQRLLDKLVDPELPAQLHVKPSSVSFVQLNTAAGAIVLIANQGSAPLEGLWWTPPAGVVDTELGGIAGQSVALGLTLPAAARRGWLPGFLRVEHAAVTADVRIGNLVFLVAGQSNAVGLGAPLAGWPEAPHAAVRMLGNDYRWRDAAEPLDDATGQLDSVSNDGDFVRYSFGTRFGNLLHDATGYPVYLIPAAKGASKVSIEGDNIGWVPASPLNRGSLFGSANYRAQVSAGLQPNPISQPFPAEGGPVSAVVWYQGESDRSESQRAEFVKNTNAVMDAFAAQLGAPTIAVQLATFCTKSENTRIHAVSELQRRLETGYGDLAREGFHLVVAFDLPRSDCIHLSAYGQRVLAERIDLAVREHVLGEPVDGTGPRMVSLSHSGEVVTLRTTHTLEPGLLNPGFFTVWAGPPQSALASDNDDNVIRVLQVARSSSDPTAVSIRLAAPVSGGQLPYVRYMSPVNLPCCLSDVPSDEDMWDVVASGTIRAAGGGLPLPAFGPLPPFTAP